MVKRVLFPGLFGGIVLMILTFLLNGILHFNSSINMKRIPDEQRVYEVLKEYVIEPGRYVCNPEASASTGFPAGEPVFSILYGGMGHEAAGGLMLLGFAIFLIAPIIATWMLSLTSDRIISSYPLKVLFFSSIGLLFALYGDLLNYGIGDYPLRESLLLGLHNILTWTIVGIVVAWRMKPVGNSS